MARIVIIDDDEPTRRTLVAILEDEGHVAVALHGPEALLDQVQIVQPDLVLIDVHLRTWGMD